MLYFVVNPASSTGLGLKKWEIIENQLIENKIEYSAHLTKGPLDAKKYVQRLTTEHDKITLITIGGDGTVNEVLSGINDISKITFGYIPSGSSNDLARALSLPSDPIEALNSVLHPSAYKEINVGVIECNGKTRNFAVSTGIGYDASICHEALHSNLKKSLNKIGLGKLTYVLIALRQLAKTQSRKCTIILDNDRRYTLDKFLFVTVMNHKYEGGGFMFCPDAVDDDDYLDICAINNIPKLKVLRILPSAYKGNHVKFAGITTYRAKKITVRTDEICCVHSDGESCGLSTEMNVALLDKKLKMIIK